MNSNKVHKAQDIFLNTIRQNKTLVHIFLVNGIKLQGVVIGFDMYSIVLVRDSRTQLVYKHAISTVIPIETVQVDFQSEEEE